MKTFHVFRRGAETCCLDGDDLSARAIDLDTARLLADVKRDPSLSARPAFRDALSALGLVRPEIVPRETSFPAPVPVTALTLCVTTRCNLRCVYCYARDGDPRTGRDMTERTALAAVDWLIDQSGRLPRLTFSLIGGEPLLAFPLLRRTVAYAKARGAETGKAMEFSLTTNGTLLDPAKADWVAREMSSVAVSCDGPREIHDARRPRRDGRGSFTAVAAGAARLLRRGQARRDRLLARAVWSDRDDPRLVRDALADLGFSRISLGPASPSPFSPGNGLAPRPRDLASLAALAEEEAALLLSLVKARDVKRLRRSPFCTPIVMILQRFINTEKKMFHCGLGRTALAVSGAGDVYPCHRFVGDPDRRLGDLKSGPTGREAYGASPVSRRPDCVACFAKYLCGGGCDHDNLGMTGSRHEPAPDFCRLTRRQVEIAAALRLDLDTDDRAWLVERGVVAPKHCPLDF